MQKPLPMPKAIHAQGYALAHAYPYVKGYALALALALIKAEHLWQVRTITTT